jgi:excisionase family DNA binding protein
MKAYYITVGEFCCLYGLKKTKTYALIKTGELSIAKIGRRTLILHASAEQLMARSLVGRAN